MLRVRFRWLLLIAGLFLAPQAARAQMDVPPVLFTGPFSHPRYESGGLYTGFQFLYWRTNQPLRSQSVAFRGFYLVDNALGTPGSFFGSQELALDVEQLMGSHTYQPGWDIFIGWRFEGGIAVELGWRHLVQARYTSSAGLLAPSANFGNALENTFLTAFVVNFPRRCRLRRNFPQGNVGTTFGI